MEFFKKLPYPIAGTALGFAALGNLLAGYHPMFKPAAGIVSAVLVGLLLIKIALMPRNFADAMKMPLVASSFATFPMAVMILTTYLPKTALAQSLWLAGASAHCILILWFTWEYIMKGFKIQTVFPSWFIVYVGIAAASVSASYHGYQSLGMAAFWFALATYLILLAIVTWRMIKSAPLPEPARPTIAIYAAPASLLLAGYISSAEFKMLPIVYGLLILSLGFYALALIRLPKLLSLPFAPSHSSFTFPFVISAIAVKATAGYLAKTGSAPIWLDLIARIQPWIALALCALVLLRYLTFLFQSAPASQTVPAK